MRMPLTTIGCCIVLLSVTAPRSCAHAQQQSPVEQAIGAKLMQEIQSGLNCSVSLITAQAELAKAQARIKELEKTVGEKEKP